MANIKEQEQITERAHRNGRVVTRNGAGAGRSGQDNPSDEEVVEEQATTPAEPEAEEAAPPAEAPARPVNRPFRKGRLLLFLLAAALLVGGIFGLRYWSYAQAHESTDDAFLDGHIVQVSPKVGGYVAKVYVKDNQQVKAGELIAELDARDYETKLRQAQAALAAGEARLREANTAVNLTRANTRASVQQASATVQQARSNVATQRAAAQAEAARITQASAGVTTAQANVEQAQALVAAAQAEATRAQADVARYQQLYEKDEISRQRLEQAVATARTANAQLDAARQRVAAAEAQVREARAAQTAAAQNTRRAETQIGGAQAGVTEALGRLAQANTAPQQVAVSQAQAETVGSNIAELRAAVAQAELELSYTKIYAPEDGRVTRKNLEEGALLQAGQPLMAIVSGDVWVTANFKENQIGNVQPGQPVEIKVDAYPGRTFKGHVDSIQSGTGARFSVIPAENATGNFVKVVQRVPVKIVFDEKPDANHLLAPGMSVEPEVKTK